MRLNSFIAKLIGSRRENQAFRIALALYGFNPVIYYPNKLGSIAFRFKAMLNENSKTPSYIASYPEIFHNEIEIYSYTLDSRHTPYILSDESIYPKILIEFLKAKNIRYLVWNVMSSKKPIYNILSAIALHDIASIYLSVLKNVDPYSTPSINQYKEMIRKWSS